MTRHDTRYRDLFNHMHLVRALFDGILQACVDNGSSIPGVDELDWSGAHMLPATFVTDDLQQRHGDCIWQLPYRDGRTVYVLLSLEHQSRVDHHMALRVMVYVGLLYQSLIKQGMIGRDDHYPTILPVVIYSGLPPWSAATQLTDRLAHAPALRHLQPAMAYVLIDEGELLRRRALPQHNLAALLFRLEHAESIEEFQEVVHTMRKRLRRPRYNELRRSLLAWVKTELWPRRVKSVDIGHIQTLRELDIMLIEERPAFDEVPFRKGLERGRKEGREKGRHEGEALILHRLIERRFGPISDDTRARIASATSAQLEAWALNVLDAGTLDDVFSK